MYGKIFFVSNLLLLCLSQGQAHFHKECAVCDCNGSIKQLETEILALDEKLKTLTQIFYNQKEEIAYFIKTEFFALIKEMVINEKPQIEIYAEKPITPEKKNDTPKKPVTPEEEKDTPKKPVTPEEEIDASEKKTTTTVEPIVTHTTLPPLEFDGILKCINNCEYAKTYASCNSATEDGVYVLREPKTSEEAFGVYCISDGYNVKSWMIIQRRINGAIDFNRNWEAYKNGFGDPRGEYWLGLERLHALTSSAQYELWIQLFTSENQTYNAFVQNFKIDSEQEGYKAHFEGYIADPKISTDILEHNSGQEFYTRDRAQHGVKTQAKKRRMECAVRENSGWWYNRDCSYCNLNGVYPYADAANNEKRHIYWKSGLATDIIKYTHMAIRPVS